MSYTVSGAKLAQISLVNSADATNLNGKLGSPEGLSGFRIREIQQIKDKTSMTWSTVALLVGIVVVGVGLIGVIGLLHAHGCLNIPQSLHGLTAMFAVIGKTAHFGGVWTITASGLVGGTIMITFASIRLYQKSRERRQQIQEIAMEYDKLNDIDCAFNNSFTDPELQHHGKTIHIGWERDPIVNIIRKEVKPGCIVILEKKHSSNPEHRFIVIVPGAEPGTVYCTKCVDQKQAHQLAEYAKNKWTDLKEICDVTIMVTDLKNNEEEVT